VYRTYTYSLCEDLARTFHAWHESRRGQHACTNTRLHWRVSVCEKTPKTPTEQHLLRVSVRWWRELKIAESEMWKFIVSCLFNSHIFVQNITLFWAIKLTETYQHLSIYTSVIGILISRYLSGQHVWNAAGKRSSFCTGQSFILILKGIKLSVSRLQTDWAYVSIPRTNNNCAYRPHTTSPNVS
jgi:hypothetical protein